MNTFDLGETVICSITVKTAAGVLATPATSMTITITNPYGIAVVSAQNMTVDGVGLFHYDYTPTVLRGPYVIAYTATDGTRVTEQADGFVAQ